MNILGWKVYIKPFADDGVYQSDWIDVTEDVDQETLGILSRQLDDTEYDIGVYRNSSIQLTMRNDHGRYSDINVQQSIFKFKRSNSLVRFTYQKDEDGPICGDMVSGDAYLSEEVDIFIGLLSDESLSLDLDALKTPFQVLGLETILETALVPLTDIANGDLFSSILYACLNQSVITEVLTVDPLNINLGVDLAVDDLSTFDANSTVDDVVKEILKISNSVFFVNESTIYIAPRSPSVDLKATFYGQASDLAPENIVTIQKIKTGLARTFNSLSWNDSPVLVQDPFSIEKLGVRTREFNSSLITDHTKQTTVLDSVLAEFGNPAQELDLVVPITFDNLALSLLDRVTMDYPIVYKSVFGADIPICGHSVCGSAVLPKGLWAFSTNTETEFKILSTKMNMKSGNITFHLREIL